MNHKSRGSHIVIHITDKISTDNEFKLFIEELPYLSRNRLVWEFMYETGARLIDTVGLQTFNFSDHYKKCEYFPKKKTNVERMRVIYLPDWFASKLEVYVSMCHDEIGYSGGYLFSAVGHGANQGHITADSMRVNFSNLRKRLIKRDETRFKFLTDMHRLDYDPITGERKLFYRFAPHTFRAVYNTETIRDIGRMKEEHPELGITDIALTAKELLAYEDLPSLLRYHRLAIKDKLLQGVMMERKKRHTLQEQSIQPIG